MGHKYQQSTSAGTGAGTETETGTSAQRTALKVFAEWDMQTSSKNEKKKTKRSSRKKKIARTKSSWFCIMKRLAPMKAKRLRRWQRSRRRQRRQRQRCWRCASKFFRCRGAKESFRRLSRATLYVCIHVCVRLCVCLAFAAATSTHTHIHSIHKIQRHASAAN